MNTRREILWSIVRYPAKTLGFFLLIVYLFVVLMALVLPFMLLVMLPFALLWVLSPLVGLIKPSWGHTVAQPWVNSDNAVDRFMEFVLIPADWLFQRNFI